ncbi:hypothetical protein C5B85_14120 [Pseudoclavibacter sp. AY1F1]|nr:hypothetical protein C5B85_14120 [Pseudoclavibacter sp. AY1F1]
MAVAVAVAVPVALVFVCVCVCVCVCVFACAGPGVGRRPAVRAWLARVCQCPGYPARPDRAICCVGGLAESSA